MSQEVIRKNLLDNIQKRADSIENLNVNVDDADADKLIKLYDPNNMNINIEETNKILEEILILPHLKALLEDLKELKKTPKSASAAAPAALAARTAAAAARTASPTARTAAPAAVLKTALKKLIKKYTGNCIIDIEKFTTEIINLITNSPTKPPTNSSKGGKANSPTKAKPAPKSAPKPAPKSAPKPARKTKSSKK